MIKYFHELTKEEFDNLFKTKMTWGECAKNYPQPVWCGYPNAVQGEMGCWSLMRYSGAAKVSEDYCRRCDYCISRKNAIKPLARWRCNGEQSVE